MLFSGCIDQLDKRRFAGLQVTTNHVAATLYLNDEYISDTPFNKKDLQPGNYTLKIVPEDPAYVEYELPIKLTSGLLTAVIWTPGDRTETSGGVIFELERISNRQMTELTVSSIPDGAIVRVNNGEMEFTPMLRSELTPGKHDLHASLPSYVEQHHTLNLVAGHRLAVLVKLARAQDSLETPQDEQASQDAQAALNPENSTATQSATTSASPTPIRTAQPQGNVNATTPTVTITSTGFFNNNTEVLRVRSGPGAGFSELGFAQVGNSYPYLQASESGWLKIQFNSEPGWVSETYATLE